MPYKQSFFKLPEQNELKLVLSWDRYAAHTKAEAISPFRKKSFLLHLQKNLLIRLANVAQRVAGKTLYCEDDRAVLYQLPPETRQLLSWLVSQNLLSYWNFGAAISPVVTNKSIYLHPTPTITPAGKRYVATGANGIGSGATYAEAALSALGEFIERNASGSYWWEARDITCCSYQAGRKMIDPSLFNTFNQSQPLAVADRAYREGQSLHWKSAKDFTSGRRVHIPAVLVYMYFMQEYDSEPFLYEVSSNGAATFSNYHEASVRAVLELIERHVFIRMWYHQGKRRKITLSSLVEQFPQLQRFLESLPSTATVTFYEITDTTNIPTVMATLTNTDPTSSAVHVTAAADVNIDNALIKTIKEITRFAEEQYPSRKQSTPPFDPTDPRELQEEVSSLRHRSMLWSYQEMLPHLTWLAKCPEITYQDILPTDHAKMKGFTYRERYRWLQERCREVGLRIYIANVTNSVARHAGLTVVRAVSPDVAPIFFSEAFIPQEYPPFSHNETSRPATLNPIPHPFI